MEALDLILLGRCVPSALLGQDVDHDGAIPRRGVAKRLLDRRNVVTIDGACVADAERFEEGVGRDQLAQRARDAMHSRVCRLADAWNLAQDVAQPFPCLDVGRVQPQARERFGELRDGGRVAPAVVVQHDDDAAA